MQRHCCASPTVSWHPGGQCHAMDLNTSLSCLLLKFYSCQIPTLTNCLRQLQDCVVKTSPRCTIVGLRGIRWHKAQVLGPKATALSLQSTGCIIITNRGETIKQTGTAHALKHGPSKYRSRRIILGSISWQKYSHRIGQSVGSQKCLALRGNCGGIRSPWRNPWISRENTQTPHRKDIDCIWNHNLHVVRREHLQSNYA